MSKSKKKRKILDKSEKPFDNTLFTKNCVYMTYSVSPK